MGRPGSSCPPGMVGCPETCGHKVRVRAYQEERRRLEDRAEAVANGKGPELEEALAEDPPPLFADWLRQTRSRRDHIALEAPCHRCGQPVGEPCRTGAGRPADRPHLARWLALGDNEEDG